jgi:hypothetical protein
MHNIEKAFIQVYICLILALFAWNSINTVRFPYGADYGEAPLMDQARRIETGGTLYKSDINEPPYVIANYPPLYPAWVAATNFILKIPLFQAGRITSVIFSLISGVIIGLFIYHLTGNKWYGVFGASLFWGQPFVLIWSSFARVDMMALAFSLLGLWILYRYKDSTIGILSACLCFLFSAFTRQTYLLSGPLAGFIWLWHCNRKRALVFILPFGAAGLLIVGMINAITNGGFLTNIVLANINRYDFIHGLSLVRQLLFIWPVILIVSLIIMILAIVSRFKKVLIDPGQTLQQPFIFYWLVFYTMAALITAITINKVGSNVNYFLELIAACAIWGGIALKIIFDQKKLIKWALFGIIFIQSIMVLGYSYKVSQLNLGGIWGRLEVNKTIDMKVRAAVQDGTVISDDYMDMIVLSGQPIYYQPFEYGELYYAGLWDPKKYVNQIEERQFPLIIIGGNSLIKGCCWSPSMVNAMESNYQVEAGNNVLILTPKK